MAKDQDGILWIGTPRGLNAFDKKTGIFTRYLHDPADPGSLGSDSIRAILIDRAGIIWIGTNDQGLDRFDPHLGRFTHYRPDPPNPPAWAAI